MSAYCLVDVSGNRYEIGWRLGKLYAERGLPWFRPPCRLDEFTPEQIDFARRHIPWVKAYIPGLLLEIQGLADALEVPFDTALVAVLTSGMTPKPWAGAGIGCTVLAVRNEEGEVLMGRNLDFRPAQGQGMLYLARFTRPTDGYATFGGTCSLLSYTEGINEHGLAIAMAIVPVMDYGEDLLPRYPPDDGVLFSVAIRAALETCRSTSEAVAFLLGIPHLEAFNYVVADLRGEMAVVEASPWGCAVRYPKSKPPMVVATNYFAGKLSSLHDKQPQSMQAANQWLVLRQEWLERAPSVVSFGGARLDIRALKRLMQLVALDPNAKFGTTTIWSECFNLTTGEIWWCGGNPLHREYAYLGTIAQPKVEPLS